jgi:hypothetical protein
MNTSIAKRRNDFALKRNFISNAFWPHSLNLHWQNGDIEDSITKPVLRKSFGNVSITSSPLGKYIYCSDGILNLKESTLTGQVAIGMWGRFYGVCWVYTIIVLCITVTWIYTQMETCTTEYYWVLLSTRGITQETQSEYILSILAYHRDQGLNKPFSPRTCQRWRGLEGK